MEHFEFDERTRFRSWLDNNNRPVVPIYWRGQKDPSWPLASCFERIILNWSGGHRSGASKVYPYDNRYMRNGGTVWEKGFIQEMRVRYLQDFKQAASGLRGPNPAVLDDDQWWALGRHFGLVTPLLDWTDSPYIAAFFALSELFTEIHRS